MHGRAGSCPFNSHVRKIYTAMTAKKIATVDKITDSNIRLLMNYFNVGMSMDSLSF